MANNLVVSPEEARLELARRHLSQFSRFVYPDNSITPFHSTYYEILTLFAHEKIRNLIITVPPQHGKSEGSTRLLPAYIHGLRPNTRIAVNSYSSPFAMKFNRAVQRIIDEPIYHEIFPNTNLNGTRVVSLNNYLKNATEYEIVGHKGSLLAVGRGGAITGNPVDVMIMDDLYKDQAEGNSPLVRESVIQHYEGTVVKRLNNDSQQLIVFTRWHPEDLIGYIEANDTVVNCKTWEDIHNLDYGDYKLWAKINFEALKETDKTELDPREEGEALWPQKHSVEKLMAEKERNLEVFNCMNQGNPTSQVGLLYGEFSTYDYLPSNIIRKGNYTDTADMGEDYLCSVCYEADSNGMIYLIDVVYTQESMETTEGMVARMLSDNNTRQAQIESNAGGRAFARNVQDIIGGACEIEWFHQGQNKESRILTNAPQVNRIKMPSDWKHRWPLFYEHLRTFKKTFRANKNDDAPDCLTGIVENVRAEEYDVFA